MFLILLRYQNHFVERVEGSDNLNTRARNRIRGISEKNEIRGLALALANLHYPLGAIDKNWNGVEPDPCTQN